MAKRKGKRIDAYVSDHDYSMMESYCIRNNTNKADVIREALNNFLSTNDKEYFDYYVNKQQLKAGYYIKL